jgi:hypothetical protein
MLCKEADRLMKKYDPCKMNGDRCLGLNYPCCFNTNNGTCPDLKDGTICTRPNIKCKVSFCETAMGAMSDECFEAFKELEIKSDASNRLRSFKR